MASVEKTREKTEYDRLRQAILSFTGVLAQSSDPKAREAAHLLYTQVKAK